MSDPHVRWLAAVIRPQVRHAARYDRVTEYPDNNYAQGTTLCSQWRVWQNGERWNDFPNLHTCARCYEVLNREDNAEEFFGADSHQREAAEQRNAARRSGP